MAKQNDEIDVSQEVGTTVDGARGPMAGDSNTRRRTRGVRVFMGVIIAIAAVIGGFLTWEAWKHNRTKQEEAQAKPTKVENTLPPLKPYVPEPDTTPASDVAASAPVASQPVAASAPVATTANGQPQKSPAELLRDRRLDGGLTGESQLDAAAGGAGDAGSAAAAGAMKVSAGGGDSALESQLKPMKLEMAKATVLKNRDFLLTRGDMIDCGQQSKLITDQLGMVTCYTTADVYSTNKRVVVIDAGSKVVGAYQRGIVQGQKRVFVMWERIETPKGVVVELASPGTDALGAAGEPGQVDTHFWERFGGAIMLSVLSDVGQAGISYLGNLANNSGNGGNTNITLGNTQSTTNQLASTALQNSINIPPTLYKNQGERVSIFVARDLDFSDVYSLR